MHTWGNDVMNLKTVFSRIRFNDMKAPHPARHKSRIVKITNAIEERFQGVNRPEKIRLKHIYWVVNHWFEEQQYKPSTRADYLNSLKLLIEALGRWEHWAGPLGLNAKGPGGRPMIRRVVKSKKYYR